MAWLAFGIVYSLAYAGVGFLLRDQNTTLSWFRALALLVLPLTGAATIGARRRTWTGCQWVFWSTIALGLTMSAIGLSGWATEELLFAQQSWLAWPAVFTLFGNVAPLFALLAQPHKGAREPLAASTSIDIAGLAVVTGFLYSFFVTGPEAAAGAGRASTSLLIVSELQALVVAAGLVAATFSAHDTEWRDTYRRLALGALVSFVMLTLSNVQIGRVDYRSAFVFDFTWILPFAFFPWAAARAPASETLVDDAAPDPSEVNRPTRWVIFAIVALVPVIDFGLRQVALADVVSGFRDLSSAVAIISVLPLLVARIATERAELQQASHTTRLLAQVIEQAHDLVLVLTPDGRYRHANDAFCRATGFSREKLKDARPHQLIPDDGDAGSVPRSLRRAGDSWRGTITRSRRDGTTFPVAASMALVVDDWADASYVVSVERDVSEERRLREQLIHSERLSAVGQLVAGVAHELNNPLQTVIGVADLMIQSEPTDETRRDLEQVQAAGLRAARIVRSLLAFTRRSTRETAMADLNEIVRSTLELRAYELRSADIAVDEAYAEPSPLVVVNREEIQQIVLNLLLNAEQAIRGAARPGTIRVRTAASEELAVFEIADDGPGVPPDKIGRIFEPFFTTKEVGQGTGLGLSISLGIAEAHGGSLTLVPADHGACFRLSLPSLPSSVRSEIARTNPSGSA